MVRLVGKGKDSPAGVQVNISGGNGSNVKRETVIDITLTLNAVVTIITTCPNNNKSAFCPKCVCD